MEISKEIYVNLVNCNWLKQCGCVESCIYDFDTYPVKNEMEAIKGILSTKWENICLEERGNLTAYLACKQKEQYKHWNYGVEIIKKVYLPQIKKQIERNLRENNFSKEILDEMSFNIISILMADLYSEYYQCTFFKNLLKIYLAGQLPCGWEGKYPEGKIKVY